MEVARVMIVGRYADIEHPLDYLIPTGLKPFPGSIVRVPLGTRVVIGIVIALASTSEISELKEILSLEKRSLPFEFLALANWLAVQAGCSIATAFSPMLPPSGYSTPLVRWQLDENAAAAVTLSEKQKLVVDYLRGQSPKLKKEISKALGVSQVPIDNLIAKSAIVAADSSFPTRNWNLAPVTELSVDQSRVLNQISGKTANLTQGAFFLLHGVTSSGKTEIYIRLARQVVATGRQVLVLTPEIALTAQLVARFKGVFSQVALLHSGLTASLRAAEWDKIRGGQVSIVIGTRSAVFSPLANIGLIIVDEEHEPAYKEEESPRYHARCVAEHRAIFHDAVLLLGSATPAIETYNHALKGSYTLLQLPNRIYSQHPIETEIIDMRQELRQGNRGMLSAYLVQALKDTLARKEQALLFLNRRGLAPTVLCRSCGFRYTCQNCSTSLTLHQGKFLKCHHCGNTARLSATCPNCGSEYLRELGAGTQKLEAYLASEFPGVNLVRVDKDTADSAKEKEKHLYEFYQQSSGILLGTQMIAKGLDFPKVTLVGIVLADLSLAIPDFRAVERTFQLVTQAGGRTGRAGSTGKVVIQTYEPDHYSLQYALAGDYLGFFQQECANRLKGGLPPYSHLTRILISDENQPRLLKKVEKVDAVIKEEKYDLLFSGPPPLAKVKRRWRWHFLLRHPLSPNPWEKVYRLRHSILSDKSTRVVIDNNPYSFM